MPATQRPTDRRAGDSRCDQVVSGRWKILLEVLEIDVRGTRDTIGRAL